MITLAFLFYVFMSMHISYEFTKDSYTEFGYKKGKDWPVALLYGFSLTVVVVLVLIILLSCVFAFLKFVIWIGTNMP